MDIHEYQSKEILADYGVSICKGGLAYSPEQAAYRAIEIGGECWIVKAQIHSCGRGKAGGIKLCKSEMEVSKVAEELLGTKLITDQTGPQGKVCHRLYVEAACDIEREIYLAFVLDRDNETVSVIASTEGGIEFEELAASKSESIIKIAVEPAVGMQTFQAREIAFALELDKTQVNQAVTIILGCYRAMRDLDATMVEINPLVVTKEGNIIAVDAKMSFDDNALFRHHKIAELRDKSQENTFEMFAVDRGMSYVGLNGNIGCIVNGAGLAMATMDMIMYAGGKPANFLDIGSSASPERIAKALDLILSDEKVECILINIFAGINRCDWIAENIVKAIEQITIKVPLIIRLSGTNAEEGRKILINSKLPIIMANTLKEAADESVAVRKQSTCK